MWKKNTAAEVYSFSKQILCSRVVEKWGVFWWVLGGDELTGLDIAEYPVENVGRNISPGFIYFLTSPLAVTLATTTLPGVNLR